MKIDTKNYQKDGVNVLGYFSLEKGLGQSVRDVANCLEKNNVNWSGIDFAVGGNGNCSDDSYIDKITDLVKYETSIVHINGDQYPLLESKGPRELWKTYKVGIIYWELPEMQSLFMGLYNKVDEFWAPTKYIKDILDKTAPCPVVYMPYGIERPEIDVKKYSRKHYNLPEHSFLFFNMFDVHSTLGRKNPQGPVDAFKKAFSPTDMSVGMVLKVNNYNQKGKEGDTLRNLVGDYKNIYIISGTIPHEEVMGLINVCDASVSLHRSEGLGLLCMESMYYGKPVIATGWSGNMDFMNKENSCLVDYEFVKVGTDDSPYESWQHWANPDINQASNYMKKISSDNDYYKHISMNARDTIHVKFSPQNCGKNMKQRLNEIDSIIENGYTGNGSEFIEATLNICLAAYQKFENREFDGQEKAQIKKRWAKGSNIDVERIATDLTNAKQLRKVNDEQFYKIMKITLCNEYVPNDELKKIKKTLKEKGRMALTSFLVERMTKDFDIDTIEEKGTYEEISKRILTDEKKWGNHSDNYLLIKAMKSSQKCANNRKIFTKKKKIGQLVIFVKRVIRKSIGWYINPLFKKQTQFNTSTTKLISDMEKRIEYLEDKLSESQNVIEAVSREIVKSKWGVGYGQEDDDMIIYRSGYRQEDQTDDVIKTFFMLKPSKEEKYLLYGYNTPDKTVNYLRGYGYKVFAYTPKIKQSNNKHILTNNKQLEWNDFAGVFSSGIMDDENTFYNDMKVLSTIMRPNAVMAHAIGKHCIEDGELKESLFCYPTEKMRSICEEFGFDVIDIINENAVGNNRDFHCVIFKKN